MRVYAYAQDGEACARCWRALDPHRRYDIDAQGRIYCAPSCRRAGIRRWLSIVAMILVGIMVSR